MQQCLNFAVDVHCQILLKLCRYTVCVCYPQHMHPQCRKITAARVHPMQLATQVQRLLTLLDFSCAQNDHGQPSEQLWRCGFGQEFFSELNKQDGTDTEWETETDVKTHKYRHRGHAYQQMPSDWNKDTRRHIMTSLCSWYTYQQWCTQRFCAWVSLVYILGWVLSSTLTSSWWCHEAQTWLLLTCKLVIQTVLRGHIYKGNRAQGLRLMTQMAANWARRHRLHTNHFSTFLTSSAMFSGSDLIMRSNSANCTRHTHTPMNMSIHHYLE